MKLLTTTIPLLAAFAPFAAARQVCSNAQLRVDVYHQDQESVHYQGKDDLSFSPTAFTLISSAHEAVLVDSPSLAKDGANLASWIARTAPGKKLKYIYITHAHADHFNSFPAVLAKFPDARVVTAKGVLEHMPEQYEEPVWSNFWKGLFPSIEKANLSLVHQLPTDGTFSIEQGKYSFRSIPVGGGDTADSTVLYVPDIDVVVGGDVIYGKCFQYLAENPTVEDRKEWLQSLDEIAALKPKYVVPSHMQADEDYGPHHLEDTKRYIETWGAWLGTVKTWQELEEWSKARFADRVGSFILRYSAQTFFNATF
jgi:glyoxylase-like metal-dependent hydrolase (beta-lactamase superfamily II)